MKTFSIAGLTVVMLVLQYTCGVLVEGLSPEAQKHTSLNWQSTGEEAKELWEQAISAKGGRDKLLSVKNMVVSSRAEYTTHQGKRNSTMQEELLVFPDKRWLWTDMRPDVFGLRIDMINYATKIRYVVGPDQKKEDEIRHLSDEYKWEESPLLSTQVLYFMETTWVKPVPMAVRRSELKNRSIDVVQTQVNGKRVDFALDSITHLPVRCIFYETLSGLDVPTIVTDLAQYVDIVGVRVPQQLTPEGGSTYFGKIRLNVKYNEDIFIRATTIEEGPGAWKPKPEK